MIFQRIVGFLVVIVGWVLILWAFDWQLTLLMWQFWVVLAGVIVIGLGNAMGEDD